MSIRVQSIEMFVLNLRARLPFRYGITTLTALPHLFLQARVVVDGTSVTSLAADSLPPKWFTKNPDTTFENDLGDMIDVIRHACDRVIELGEASSVFDLWYQLHQDQHQWAMANGYPPLLAGFGVSLVERALIDAFCRATGTTFAQAARANHFGIRPGVIYPELRDVEPADALPAQPASRLTARHTVGLGDPLDDADIAPGERLEDGLPQSLQAAIRTYGLTHFKVKLRGDPEQDRDRLQRLARLLDQEVGQDYALTLDGNENFRDVAPFRAFWESLSADPAVEHFLSRLLFVEQPLHRDVALGDEAGRALREWGNRPPIIIDESDGELDALRQALDRGYAGTSHKNCKGVFKSIVNACLIAARREETDRELILSAEDLANVGPVALLQDLAVVATLGIPHVERNGHHYFAGLRFLPGDLQEAVLDRHADLYHRGAGGFATLDIRDGTIATGSVIAAPFGYDVELDPSRFTPLDAWNPASLGATAP